MEVLAAGLEQSEIDELVPQPKPEASKALGEIPRNCYFYFIRFHSLSFPFIPFLLTVLDRRCKFLWRVHTLDSQASHVLN